MKPLLILKTYAWLVNTISNKGPISYKDIIGLWKKDRLSEGNSMVRQTFIHYKNDLEEFFNISIGMDKMYRYYIKSGDALQKDTVENWMLTSLSVNTALLNNKKVYKRIVMENTPSAGGFLKEIVEAMMKNVMLDIVYHRYDHSCDRQHRLAPYFVKLYHQRWYLLGRKEDGALLTFALDRIVRLELTKKKFKFDESLNASNYFEDCYGVMRDETKPAERIVLRAYGTEANYLRDLKLHHSQKEIATADEYSDFELFLRPSMDFRGKIMERGERLKVMEPEHLAAEIEAAHLQSVKLYENRKDILKV